MIHNSDIVNEALMVLAKHDGIPYVWGGKTTAGFDCSGLVTWVLREMGFSRFPHGSYNQYDYCKSGAVSNIDAIKSVPGVLLFRRSRNGRVAHVALSAPHRRTIEARGRKYGVGMFEERIGWSDACLIPGVYYG